MSRLPSLSCVLVLAWFGVPGAHAAILDPGETRVASCSSQDACANQDSYLGAVSGNGRFVVFQTKADNLDPTDLGGNSDVYLRDLSKGSTVRISRNPGGGSPNADSSTASISRSGRIVVFTTAATDIVPGDTNGVSDVFAFDRKLGKATRISVASDGAQANGASQFCVVSAGGRYVAFTSQASNLVASDTNGKTDVFVHDRKSGKTERVSVATGGIQATGMSLTPAISASGRFVAFWSDANDIDGVAGKAVFLHDRKTDTTSRVSLTSSGASPSLVYPESCSISANGRFVAFSAAGSGVAVGDTYAGWDIFVRDTKSGTTELVSTATDGSVANNECLGVSISGNGRFVAFDSIATTLVAGDTGGQKDVFVRDRSAGTTVRISTSSAGVAANKTSELAGISHDGRTILFGSYATNLTTPPTTAYQTFVHGL